MAKRKKRKPNLFDPSIGEKAPMKGRRRAFPIGGGDGFQPGERRIADEETMELLKQPALEIGDIEIADSIELDAIDLSEGQVLPALEILLSRAEKNKTLRKKDRKLLKQFAAASRVK